MNNILIKQNYPLSEKDFIANQFIIGNGRLGYRGTLEEDGKEERVTFNVVGVYDQYKDKWRESLNLFNPLFLKILNENHAYEQNAIDHQLKLIIEEAVVTRKSVFPNITLTSERFIHKQENVIAAKIKLKAAADIFLRFMSGIDEEVYEINGPHYVTTSVYYDKNIVCVTGKTNENSIVQVMLKEVINKDNFTKVELEDGKWLYEGKLKKGDALEITKIANIVINEEKPLSLCTLDYDALKGEHVKLFKKRFNESRILLNSTRENLEFYVNYAIYHLLILENERYQTSIPARGLSGQVYKGAIFWDTEIFMLPFYLTTNINFARNLVMYRINTLTGAKNKAKEFGFEGAFYAWESQEDGRERCSLYNVTDAETGQPIRTYFADKQIHISADVIFGLNKYLDVTNDYSVLHEGGLDVFVEVFKFYKSYATLKDGRYYFNDVVGPDEYHERVDNNAFTNYQIKLTLSNLLTKINRNAELRTQLESKMDLGHLNDFLTNIYLPKPGKNGVIEQFDNYFALEDINVATLKKRIKNPQAYLGGEKGLATNTRVIKQADVIALLALYPDLFSEEIVRANFDFYEDYTEHGSSLSNAMYGLVSARLGEEKTALDFLEKSAKIDLTTTYKLWAGAIFIGGTHPASSGGAYLIIKEGFLGLKHCKGKANFTLKLPREIKNIKLNYYEKGEMKQGGFAND